MEGSTIAAIATPPGTGGIGIIKISGPKAINISKKIFRPKKKSIQKDVYNKNTLRKYSHKLIYGHIINPENQRIIDEALVTNMLAPHTYTREDIVEIHSHAGFYGLKSIMEIVISQGARLADPGEFTKRAYINGRIDLTQAEAVIEIINAKSELSLQMATSQISGQMEKMIQSIIKRIFDLIIMMEASIDFPEETDEILEKQNKFHKIKEKIKTPLETLIKNHEELNIYREGIKIVVIGKPNVGKSSLLNQILQTERAIVTPIPGTTRDIIQETIHLNRIPVTITDTAGLHDTTDPIELIGMERTKQQLMNADIILLMINGNEPMKEQDIAIAKNIDLKKTIVLINKIDKVKDRKITLNIPNLLEKNSKVKISAKYNIGLNKLKNEIEKRIIGGGKVNNPEIIVPNLRQKNLLKKANELIQNALSGIQRKQHSEIVIIDLKEAMEKLEQVIGIKRQHDILDQIFSKFCIGK